MASEPRHSRVRYSAVALGVAMALIAWGLRTGDAPLDPVIRVNPSDVGKLASAHDAVAPQPEQASAAASADPALPSDVEPISAASNDSAAVDAAHFHRMFAVAANTPRGAAPFPAPSGSLAGSSGATVAGMGGGGAGGGAYGSPAPSFGGGRGGGPGASFSGPAPAGGGLPPLAGSGGPSGGAPDSGSPPEEPETDVASNPGGPIGGGPPGGGPPSFGGNPSVGSGPSGGGGPAGGGPLGGTGPGVSPEGAGTGGLPEPIVIADLYSPGHSPGLDVYEDDPGTTGLDEGHLILDGILRIEIGGLARGTEYDAIDAETVELGGTLEVVLIAWPEGGDIFAPAAGNTFDIIIADEIVGDFAVFEFPLLAGGLFWSHEIVPLAGAAGPGQFAYRLTVGQELAIQQFAEAPEPGALIVFLAGAALLLLLRRRRIA